MFDSILGEQTCMVNNKGRDICDKNLFAVGVGEQTTRAIIQQMAEALAGVGK